jgi:hypothetical protein
MSTLKEAVAAGRDLQEDTGNHTAPHGDYAAWLHSGTL